MPFQSEKQRRYLWANEPEIARDWTDTYGSRIEKNNGGIMRLPFAEGDIVDDQGNVFEETEYTDLTEEQFDERFGGEYEENLTPWYQENTLADMWNDPDRPQISKGLGTIRDWATDKFSTGIDWGRMAMQGIGNMVMPGLGFVMGAMNPDKMRGYNYGQGRFNTQQEYEANRAARQQQARIGYMMDRRGANKGFSQKNLNAVTMGLAPPGFYGNQWGGTLTGIDNPNLGKAVTDRTSNVNSPQHPGSTQNNPGVDRGIGSPASRGKQERGGHHFYRGGIANLWPR